MEKQEYVCAICGQTFIASSHRNVKYCSNKCRYKAKAEQSKSYKELAKEAKERHMTQKALAEYLKRLEHQADKTVWIRDYAERQKQKTLEMMGKIEI